MEYWKWQLVPVFMIVIAVHGSKTTRVNIALNKPTEQSSLGPTSQTPNGYAWKAVDGNTNGLFNKGSCTHNRKDFENGTEWWEVDLEELYNVTEIIVYSRSDTCCLNWLDDYVLSSGVNCETGICYSECYKYNKTDETVKVNLIPEGCIAQHIRLSVIHKSLVLCEVEIFGELIPIVSSTLLPSTEISSDGQGMVVSTSEQLVETSTEANSSTLLPSREISSDGQGMVVLTSEQLMETSTEANLLFTNSFLYTVVESTSTVSFRMTPYTPDLEYIHVDPTFSSLGSTISSLQSQIIPSSSYMNELNFESESLSPSSRLSNLSEESLWEIISPTTPISTEMTKGPTSYITMMSQDISNGQTSNVPQSPVDATTLSTIEISSTVPTSCPCLCSQLTLDGIQEKLKYITDRLILPKHNLSSVRRKKKTADDNRLSAVVAGYTGTAILCCIFGFLVSSDVLTLFRSIVILLRKSDPNETS